jgi:hypothetical protein
VRERGYLIPAINDGVTDYERCAKQLESSIKYWHPDADITIVTKDMLPYGDQGGQANDWQMYKISPYHETVKLEADMIACSHIDHWWSMFRHRDMVISLGCRDWFGRPSSCRAYRRAFDDNHLPDVYNAIAYWRVSPVAKEFFHWCRLIWQDWATWSKLLVHAPDTASTDMVYAIAAVMVGSDQVTLPVSAPNIIHMKQHVAGTMQKDWTKELVWEHHHGWVRINTVTQWGMLHYCEKDWSTD